MDRPWSGVVRETTGATHATRRRQAETSLLHGIQFGFERIGHVQVMFQMG